MSEKTGSFRSDKTSRTSSEDEECLRHVFVCIPCKVVHQTSNVLHYPGL